MAAKNTKPQVAPPEGGLLGLDMPLEQATPVPTASTPARGRAQGAPLLPRPLPPPPNVSRVVEAPMVEAIAVPWIDPANYAWGANLLVMAPGGELLAEDDARGYVTLRPDAENRMIVPSARELLGFAVEAAVAMLQGSKVPEDAKRYIDVDRDTNGFIKVSLGDMVKAFALEPCPLSLGKAAETCAVVQAGRSCPKAKGSGNGKAEPCSKPDFFYARHAWTQVLAATRGDSPTRPVIRWAR